MKFIKLPPELCDGQHSTPYGPRDGAYHLGEYLLEWLHTHSTGDSVTLEIVELSSEQFAELEDI